MQDPIKAPVEKGQNLGQVDIELNGKVIIRRPLVALQADPQGGAWTRFSDGIKLGVHKMMNKKSDSATNTSANQAS